MPWLISGVVGCERKKENCGGSGGCTPLPRMDCIIALRVGCPAAMSGVLSEFPLASYAVSTISLMRRKSGSARNMFAPSASLMSRNSYVPSKRRCTEVGFTQAVVPPARTRPVGAKKHLSGNVRFSTNNRQAEGAGKRASWQPNRQRPALQLY